MSKFFTLMTVFTTAAFASSVLAANNSTDMNANKICLQSYAKMQAQAKKDEESIKNKSLKLKGNKDPNAYKSFIKDVSSALRNEFSYMKSKKVLNACLAAAKANHKESYIPLMKAYMANQNAELAKKWCEKAVSLNAPDLYSTKHSALSKAACQQITAGIKFIYSNKA